MIRARVIMLIIGKILEDNQVDITMERKNVRNGKANNF
jgi:hypothetical protein